MGLVGLTLGLLSSCSTSAQYGRPGYGQPGQQYPPTYDRPDYGSNQPGYNQPGYGQSNYDDYYEGDFYDDLRPYGQWVRTPEYGMVWIPDAEPGFQPYATNGRWVVTEFGNTWVSDYAWGWAPFHYGRWYQDRYRGWAWVPGREWGPAWVSWRSGGGYYGWAPLGPGAAINVNIPANYWVFVPQTYITSPRLYNYCVPRRQVVNVYQNTTIINNVYRYNNRNYAYGPRRDEIERVTRQRVPVYRIENNGRPGRDEIRDNSVSIYRPGGRTAGPRGNGYERPGGNGVEYGDSRGNRYPNGNSRNGNGGTYQRPDNRGGTYTGPQTPTDRGAYEGNGRRNRYESQPMPNNPSPQAQPQQERLESLPQPSYGGGRRSGGYTRPETSQPDMSQPQPGQGRSGQVQNENQNRRMERFEQRAQEADRNAGQAPVQGQPGNPGGGRGPRGPR